MQTTIKSEVDYKDPKHYGKQYDIALDEFNQLRFAGLTVKLCKIIGSELYTNVLFSDKVIENNLKHLKIVM